MKLRALNGDKAVKYGYEPELGYDNPNFHGHQIGIAIGIIDGNTGDIVRNSLPTIISDETKRDSMLKEIIANESIIKVEQVVTQVVDNKLVPRIIYYLPYAVVEHSVYQPTVNFANICPAENATNYVTVEILFVEDGLNRYVTYTYETVNVSVMDEIYNMDSPQDIPGIEYRENSEEYGYYLDFYDEAGDKTELCFEEWDRLRDAIVSVRILDIETRIVNE